MFMAWTSSPGCQCEVKDNGIGVSVLCPMVVEPSALELERIMGADYGLSATSSPAQPTH